LRQKDRHNGHYNNENEDVNTERHRSPIAMKTALLLIAHGSRQAEANDDLHELAARLRVMGRYAVVEPAFLELAAPTIDEAGRRCIEQGADRVILVPYFLAAGVHVQRDLQAHRERLAAAYPNVAVALAAPLGPHPLLVEIVTQRAAETAFPKD
jgi:sirohydrochlorin ferrochelatase